MFRRSKTLALISLLFVTGCGERGQSGDPSPKAPAIWGQLRGDRFNRGRSTSTISENPRALWSLTVGGAVTSAICIDPNGNLRVKPEGRFLYSISPNGVLLWKASVGEGACAPIVDRFGNSYVGTDDGRVVGVDQDGAEFFDLALGPDLGSGLQWRDETYIFAGGSQVFAVSRIGELLATLDLPGPVGPQVVPVFNFSQQFFVPSMDGFVYELLVDFTELPLVSSGIDIGEAISRSTPASENGTTNVVTDGDTLVQVFRKPFDEDPGRVVWTFDPGVETSSGGASSPAIGLDGTLYYGTQDGTFFAVTQEGEEKWRYDANSAVTSSPALDAKDRIVFRTRDGRLHGLGPDGRPLFVRERADPSTAEIDSSPTIDNEGRIYIGTSTGQVIQYGSDPVYEQPGGDAAHRGVFGSQGPTLGFIDWVRDGGVPIRQAPLVMSDASTLLIGSDNSLRILSENGSLSNLFPIPADTLGVIIAEQDRIIISTQSGRVMGFNRSGESLFKTRLEEGALSGPSLRSDGVIVLASASGSVYLVNEVGEVQETFESLPSTSVPPGIGDDGRIYVALVEGRVLALDEEGRTLSITAVPGTVTESSPLIAPGGTVYVATERDIVAAIRPDGRGLWTFDPPDAVLIGGFGGPVRQPSGTIVYVSRTGVVFGFNPDTGGVRFTTDLGTEVKSAPAVDADGRLYVTSVDGTWYGLDPFGNLMFTIPSSGLGDGGFDYPPVLIGDRRAVAIDSGGVASSLSDAASWSVFHGSSDHRGRQGQEGPRNDPPSIGLSVDVGGRVELSPVISPRGDVAVLTTEGELVVVLPSGVIRFRTSVGPGPGIPAFFGGGNIVVGSGSGVVTAFDEEGTPLWFSNQGRRLSALNMTRSGNIVAASANGLLRLLNPFGETLFEVSVGPVGEGAPAEGVSGRLHVANTNSELIFVEEGGIASDAVSLPGPVSRSSPVVGPRGTTYVTTDADVLVAISGSGEELFRFDPKTGSDSGGRSAPSLLSDGSIVYGARDGRVYGLRSSGTLRFVVDAMSPISSAPLVDGRGVVYIGTDDGRLLAIDTESPDADILFDFQVDAKGGALTSPAMASDGSIVVASSNGILYQIQEP